MKFTPPSIRETAFNCPFCGALAKQMWDELLPVERPNHEPKPLVIGQAGAAELDLEMMPKKDRADMIAWATQMGEGAPFCEDSQHRQGSYRLLRNLHISTCSNCEMVAVWLHERMIHPDSGDAPPPNADMPEDIRQDYEEAGAIFARSPRGAAALLRLAIQKLCMILGQPGKNINDDIAELVRGGLDPRVQQALDVVRVIGNNAVHPGQVDLRDNQATAGTLFRLVNLIVEKTISEPKHVSELFNSLPEGAIKAIERRDRKPQV